MTGSERGKWVVERTHGEVVAKMREIKAQSRWKRPRFKETVDRGPGKAKMEEITVMEREENHRHFDSEGRVKLI